MGLYAYQAVDQVGALIAGELEADHEAMVNDRLRNMGFAVVEIRAVRASSLQGFLKPRRAVTVGELILFTRQLVAMLEAGIPLTRILFSLSRQAANPTLQEAVGEVARSLEGGAGFSDSLEAYPQVFPPLYISMIRAGEIGGNLSEVLQRLAGQLEQDKALRDNIRAATFYPIVVLSFAALVTLAMMVFLVPVFVGFFPKDAVIPVPTKVIIAVSDSLRQWWYLWLLGIGALVLGGKYFIRSPAGAQFWDRIRFKLPAFGPLLHRAVVARFVRTLSTLMAGGIPVLQALEASGPASGSNMLAEAVEEAREKIRDGKSISGPLEETGVFPPMVIDMVAVGEESGALPTMLDRVAEYYEAEVATMTKGLTALIEPLMIIVVGITVGIIVVSLYLPIFSAVAGGM